MRARSEKMGGFLWAALALGLVRIDDALIISGIDRIPRCLNSAVLLPLQELNLRAQSQMQPH
jgi:hypothetical protein